MIHLNNCLKLANQLKKFIYMNLIAITTYVQFFFYGKNEVIVFAKLLFFKESLYFFLHEGSIHKLKMNFLQTAEVNKYNKQTQSHTIPPSTISSPKKSPNKQIKTFDK